MPPRALRLPLYANFTAAVVTDPAEERALLVKQVCGRVRWRESVIAMAAAGVEHFVELGGKVLGPMIARTVPRSRGDQRGDDGGHRGAGEGALGAGFARRRMASNCSPICD